MTRPTLSAVESGSGLIIALTCHYCSAQYADYRSNAKRFERHFCSRNCSARFSSGPNHHNWSGGLADKNCQHCGKAFQISRFASARGRGRFCSKACWYAEWDNPSAFREQSRRDNLRRYTRLKQQRELAGAHTPFDWQVVLQRYSGRCAACRARQDITKDHIVPISRGGTDLIENIQPLCNSCNARKGNNLNVFAIDLGTANLGWAIGDETLKPTLGTYHPPDTKMNIGWLLADLRAWMQPMLQTYRITHIVYEAPILYAGNNPITIRKIHAMGGLLELVAYDAKIPIEEGSVNTVRKHFLGRGMTPRHREDAKRAVIARCKQLGWSPANDDEADAAALLDYTVSMKTSRIAGLQGELV